MYIVTGASSGIGRATAAALIGRDCEVTVVARRLDRLHQLQRTAPELVHPVQADLGRAPDMKRLIDEVARHEAVSGVVHAAGSPIHPRAYSDLDPEVMATDMAVHVGAPIALNAALKNQLAGGRVVYIDSYSATSLRQGWSGYSIVKAAAHMAARAAAAELEDVAVIRLFPGGVRTPLVEAVLNASERSPAVDAFRALDEQGALCSPEVVGEFIASVLIDATAAQLAARDSWDFTNPADRDFDQNHS